MYCLHFAPDLYVKIHNKNYTSTFSVPKKNPPLHYFLFHMHNIVLESVLYHQYHTEAYYTTSTT